MREHDREALGVLLGEVIGWARVVLAAVFIVVFIGAVSGVFAPSPQDGGPPCTPEAFEAGRCPQ